MERSFLAAILAVGGTLSGAQNQPSQVPTPPPTKPQAEVGPDVDALHNMRRSTVSLGLRVIDNGGKAHFVTKGSAVVVAWDQYHGCLLTAKHVLFDPERGYTPTTLYVRVPQSAPRAEDDLGVPLPLVVNEKTLWRSSSDADLAVIAVPDLSTYSDLHGIGLADFGGEDDVYQGASVVVFGYPELLGPDYQTTPIVRGGIVAWTNPEGRFDHTFLVDANIFSGNSGGPVFHIPMGFTRNGSMILGGQGKLIGIVSKDAYEESSVHAGPVPAKSINQQTGEVTPITAQVLNIGGIGIVEPASKAKKLIIESFNLKP